MRHFVLSLVLATAFVGSVFGGAIAASPWSAGDKNILRSLSIDSLPRLAKDPTNAVGDVPSAAAFGHRLFFDKRFSGDGAVSCATCHQPDKAFTDAIPLAKGMGTTARNTPTIIGTAHSPWFFWDGRTDSQWSQALQPMEAPTEHGGARTGIAKTVFGDAAYSKAYEGIFGDMADVSDDGRFPANAAPIDVAPARAAWNGMAKADRDVITQIYVNLGKAIAAYERLIMPGASRFDRYVEAVLNGGGASEASDLTADEVAGLRLFIGDGKCTQCHNGPLFTNNDFHNTGLSLKMTTPEDEGRARGAPKVRHSEFSCLGRYSDAGNKQCAELDFIKLIGAGLLGSFKTPTLRNLGKTAPFMHDGRFAALIDVLSHYNQAPAATIGITDVVPLSFTPEQLEQLRRFLLTLDSPVTASPEYLSPPKE